MENIVLNELLDKSNKDGKKVDLSKTDQNTYRSEFSKLLAQEGINSDTVSYFVKGLKAGTAYMVSSWLYKVPVEKQFPAYKTIVENKAFSELDTVNQFRIVLALSVAFLSADEPNDEIMSDLFYRFVALSKKKDGKRLTDLSKLFKAYFMDNMRHGMSLPKLSKYQFSKEYEVELVSMLREAIDGIKAKGDLEIDKHHALKDWINANKEVCEGGENDKETASKQYDEKVKDEEKKTEIAQDVISGMLSKKLFELAKAVAVCETENKHVQESISERDREISRLKAGVSKYQLANKTLLDENAGLRQSIEELRKQLEKAEADNKELVDRIGRQSAVIDVFDQDKDNSKTELLNQIATSLKKIYADYKVAENMEMTIDLGMNMRDALQDIFRKLKKMGIDIEGRQ